MKTIFQGIGGFVLLLAFGMIYLLSTNGCKQEHITLSTTSTVNMYDYLQQNPAQFSLFKQIVDKAGYTGFLNTYGTYTFFVPNNDGVNAYLKAQGKANVDAIDVATAKNLVGFALINDTISTQNFSDGKLRTPTNIGQYLITGSVSGTGGTGTVINKQAHLIKGNISVGNGLLHVIDNVLVPASLTLAKTIEQNSKYSIFTAALKATGFYDTINVVSASNPNPNRKYLTVIAETDSAFKAAGIADFGALKAKYSTKGDPTNHADSLWLFVGYHIWPELSYVSDIAVLTSHPTLAPLEITTSQLVSPNVLLNNDIFNGVLEPGQAIYRAASDVSASNGVLHNVLGNYSIKIRFPAPVYFDVATQSEIIKTPGLYRGSGKTQSFPLGTLANVYMEGQGTSGNGITYFSEVLPISSTNTNYYFNNDHIEANNRFRLGTNGLHLMEFTTPVIIKGTYKVWVDYKRNASGLVTPAYFDNVALPNTFNNRDPLNGNETDAQAEARGFKSYSDSPVTTSLDNAYNGHVGRLLGIVTITTTDHHKIRFETTGCTGCNTGFVLDVIEFRPVDMDQIHPRLGRNGNLVP